MKTIKVHVLLLLALALSLLLCAGTVFAGSDGEAELPPGAACSDFRTDGSNLEGELVLNFTNFHCQNLSAADCISSGGPTFGHAKATLRISKTKFNDNKDHIYTFNAFLGKDVTFMDKCAVIELVIAKFREPILKEIFKIDPATSPLSIRLREQPPISFDFTVDTNAKPETCIYAATDPLNENCITSFTNVVDFKSTIVLAPY